MASSLGASGFKSQKFPRKHSIASQSPAPVQDALGDKACLSLTRRDRHERRER